MSDAPRFPKPREFLISMPQGAYSSLSRQEVGERLGAVRRALDEARALGPKNREEANARFREAALMLKAMGISPANIESFASQFPGYFIEFKRLLDKIGSPRLIRSFLAVSDPQYSGNAVSFRSGLAFQINDKRLIECTYEPGYYPLLGIATYLALEQELKSWAVDRFRCERTGSAEQLLAEARPKAPEPPVAPKPAATQPVAPASPGPQPAKQPPKQIAVRPRPKKPPLTPKPAPGPTVAQAKQRSRSKPRPQRPAVIASAPLPTPPLPTRTICEERLPEDAVGMWGQARPATVAMLAGTRWNRCGYNSIHNRHTPYAPVFFSQAGHEMHLMLNGKWTTYFIRTENGHLIGQHEDPSEWMIPPHMNRQNPGQPGGSWGPCEIRILDDMLLIYFRIPATDGKDYWYAFVIAQRSV